MTAGKQPRSVSDALREGRTALKTSSASARLDAELLLALTMGGTREWLYAHGDEMLSSKQRDVYQVLLTQRADGVPLAHLTGRREFWSLEFAVNEHTLVPRPETELLVEQALARMPENAAARVLDLGTGTGAVAITIATERPLADIIATDSSGEALRVAADNAATHCPGRIRFHTGSWYDALPADSAKFSLIVSNPPYIGENETDLTDPELAYEPVTALYSGKDGLNDIRHIVAAAGDWLNKDGWLMLEHGFAQAPAVAEIMRRAGFESVDNVRDLAGQPRVSIGCWMSSTT